MTKYLAPVAAGCLLGVLAVSVTMVALIEFFDIEAVDLRD